MNRRNIHTAWYFKVLLLALLLNLGAKLQAHGYSYAVYTIEYPLRNYQNIGSGKNIKPSTLRIRKHKVDFELPEMLEISFSPQKGELELTDVKGNPQSIKINVPENASYDSIFPMLVTDNKGNTYQISPSEQGTEGTINGVENENRTKR